MKSKPNGAIIRLRMDNLALARAAAGLVTNGALSQRMGVHIGTIGRTLSGQTQLGTAFIAGLLATFPDLKFGDLFVVEAANVEPAGDAEQTADDEPAAVPA